MSFFLACGVPVSFKLGGIKAPAQRQEWVGWGFGTVSLQVFVPPEKCRKAQVRIQEAFSANGKHVLKVKAFLGCVGLLNHIAEVHVQGRRMLHACWDLVNKTGCQHIWTSNRNHNPLIQLSRTVIRELEGWHSLHES